MKKLKLLLSLLFVGLFFQIGISQACLPEGITFTSQQQLDDFANGPYADCTYFLGNILISENEPGDITDLSSLSNIIFINGELKIINNTALTNLSGLSSLKRVSEYFLIANNNNLTTLTGLQKLIIAGSSFELLYNDALKDISALNKLHTIGGKFKINNCDNLINLSGLNKLKTIGRDLDILNNDNLISLDALENLKSIGGQLKIRHNDALTNLFGLQNIDPHSIQSNTYYNLQIFDNPLLSVCNIESICGYLDSENPDVLIYDNAPDCNTKDEIKAICQLTQDCPTNLTFTSQEQIDEYTTNYPNCKDLQGYLIIKESNPGSITNLNGLSSIRTVGKHFNVLHNTLLENLNGLENLSSIGGSFELLYNDELNNLSALNQLKFINGKLKINNNDSLDELYGLTNLKTIGRSLEVLNNDALETIDQLENLETIGGLLSIRHNDVLSTLKGLENINYLNIHSLEIYDNPLLSQCNIRSVCGFFTIPNHNANIYDNATGCDSEEEIDCNNFQFCHLGIKKIYSQEQVDNFSTLYPYCTNFTGSLRIKGHNDGEDNDPSNPESTITNLNGLNQIQSITGYLQIEDNPFLINLNGLSNLTNIGSYLSIAHNDLLTNLEGLQNIDPTNISDLSIIDNPLLSECSIESVCEYLDINDSDNIYDNAPECNSTDDIKIKCFDCLPNGIQFTTQTEIDAFVIDYPKCISINGDVLIKSGENLTNDPILNIEGLSQLINIKGTLRIASTRLTNLKGLENLQSIGKDLDIDEVFYLENINDLSNLTSVGGNLILQDNDAMANFDGLDNLVSVGGYIKIWHNSILDNIDGIRNIDPTKIHSTDPTIEDLRIYKNPILSQCAIQSVCGFLSKVDFTTKVENNAPNCNSQEEVEADCSNRQFCPDEHITLSNQQQIDNFSIRFPGCTNLTVDLTVREEEEFSITNLLGLSQLETSSAKLKIQYNNALTNLSGLDNFTNIEALFIEHNDILTSLNGVSTLNNVGSYLSIRFNPMLTTLEDIRDVDLTNISTLYVVGNVELSKCDVENICDRINLGVDGIIAGNTADCFNENSLINACNNSNSQNRSSDPDQLTIFDQSTKLLIQPNPASTHVKIALSNHQPIDQIIIYNNLGQVILEGSDTTIDVRPFPRGIYYVQLNIGDVRKIEKLILQTQ